MRCIYLNITFVIFFLITNKTNAQTIWDGPMIEFTKENNADPTKTINQDIITSDVALTRGYGGEIYNATSETVNESGISPLGTEWAIGNLSEFESLTFSSFRTTVGAPKFVVGKKLVLHIIEENIYLSVEFTSWSKGKLGGFAYKRSTNNATTSSKKNISQKTISIFPNPCTDYIQTAGLIQDQHYEIFDVVGSKIGQGILEKNKKIEIKDLKTGIYFLRLESGESIRFMKR
jgi:hypothetical protein